MFGFERRPYGHAIEQLQPGRRQLDGLLMDIIHGSFHDDWTAASSFKFKIDQDIVYIDRCRTIYYDLEGSKNQ